VSSTRPVSGTWYCRTEERQRGKLVYTAQVYNLISRCLCQGFETKHGIKLKKRTIRKRRKRKENKTQKEKD
jgi:hypothetical protein